MTKFDFWVDSKWHRKCFHCQPSECGDMVPRCPLLQGKGKNDCHGQGHTLDGRGWIVLMVNSEFGGVEERGMLELWFRSMTDMDAEASWCGTASTPSTNWILSSWRNKLIADITLITSSTHISSLISKIWSLCKKSPGSSLKNYPGEAPGIRYPDHGMTLQ